MPDIDYPKSVGHWVFTAAHAMGCAMNDELAAHGITFRQFEVLAWLSRERELSQSDLAERMRIEAPTLVGVLDRMERDGWIQRVPDENDRRKNLVRPTDRVMPVWTKMVACGDAVRARATRGLNDEQLSGLRDVLAAICENMGVVDQAAVTKEG
jgi:MarR family transcriptional regulator, transcriptional regulator for hemolysin